MKPIVSKYLQEHCFCEYIINEDELMTIAINGYKPINDIDPYIKIYIHKDDFYKRRMCRISLLEPKYIGLLDETLGLNYNLIKHLYSLILSFGWEHLLHRFVSIISNEVIESNDNATYNDMLLKQQYKINDSLAESIIIPDYTLLSQNNDTVLRNRSFYDRDLIIFNAWMRYNYKSDIIYEDDIIIIKADCSSIHPLARVYDKQVLENNIDKYYTIDLSRIYTQSPIIGNQYYSIADANQSSIAQHGLSSLFSDPVQRIIDHFSSNIDFDVHMVILSIFYDPYRRFD